MIHFQKIISCPVASVLYSKGKEEGRGKREERRRGRKDIEPEKNLNFL
ncbi:MAG: hypothetical protein F6K39_17735 [Okeania sp. SIO3B3]|nr:hypothetical protein [Okeania sp. SIO3B3]